MDAEAIDVTMVQSNRHILTDQLVKKVVYFILDKVGCYRLEMQFAPCCK